jgi:formyl-CoA transferase
MVAEVHHAKAGKQKTLGVPLKLSANPGGLRRAAPTLGQHDGELRKSKPKEEKPRSAAKGSLQRSR